MRSQEEARDNYVAGRIRCDAIRMDSVVTTIKRVGRTCQVRHIDGFVFFATVTATDCFVLPRTLMDTTRSDVTYFKHP